MAEDKFLFNTRLMRFEDTLYKLKFTCSGSVKNNNSDMVTEMDDVIKAVIYMLRSNKPLVKIQTRHFVIDTSLKLWKTGQKLKFMQHDQELDVYKNQVYINCTPLSENCTGNDSASTSLPTSTERRERIETEQRMLNKAAQVVSERSIAMSSSRPKHSSSQSREDMQKRTVTNTTSRSPRTSRPAASTGISSSHSQENPPLTQASNIRYSLRRTTQPSLQDLASRSPARSRSPAKSRSPRRLSKSPPARSRSPVENSRSYQFEAAQNVNNSSLNALRKEKDAMSRSPRGRSRNPVRSTSDFAQNSNNNNASTSPGKNYVQSEGEMSPSKRKRVRPPLQFVDATDPKAPRKQTGTISLGLGRSPSSAVRMQTRLQSQKVDDVHQGDRSRRREAVQRAVSKSTLTEEHRLRTLADDSRGRDLHKGQGQIGPPAQGHLIEGVTFQQKDRYVIEEGDVQEELKLQTMASGLLQTEEDPSDVEPRSGFMRMMLRPVNWLVQGNNQKK